ncbi:MAG: NAD(P)/FAD-dependent oxidoreductase [Kiritimatiellia bacterium]
MHTRIAIVGAGFAGWRAARSLSQTAAEVTIFEPRDATVMLPALPDVAGAWLSPALLTVPLRRIIPVGMRWERCLVSTIDLENHELVADGRRWTWEVLILASGSKVAPHPWTEHADSVFKLDSRDEAVRLRDRFLAYLHNEPEGQVVIVGGGYTGLELAASLAARARAESSSCRITVVEAAARIMPFLSGDLLREVREGLQRLEVTIRTETRVEAFDGRSATVGGELWRNVMLCWTAGSVFAGPNVAGTPERLGDGRLVVEPDLSLETCAETFAAGDAAAVKYNGGILRKAVNFAWGAEKNRPRKMLWRG